MVGLITIHSKQCKSYRHSQTKKGLDTIEISEQILANLSDKQLLSDLEPKNFSKVKPKFRLQPFRSEFSEPTQDLDKTHSKTFVNQLKILTGPSNPTPPYSPTLLHTTKCKRKV